MRAIDRVMDAIDLETFVTCSTEDEAKRIIRELAAGMGLKEVDVVFVQVAGPGARVRARAYVHRAGDRYGWLGGEAVGQEGAPCST
ncbi:MAG: hypothetical protein ACM3WT_03840 [Bacillota bacterium]